MATRIFPEAACLSSGQAMAEMNTAFHNHSFGKIKRKKNEEEKITEEQWREIIDCFHL